MAIHANLYSDNFVFGVTNGNAIAGFNQWKPHPQQFQDQLQMNQIQSLCFENNLESMMYFSQLEKQRLDLDEFMRSQNERLGILLQEQRKQQVAILLKKIEPRASILLKQKDEEMLKARNKAMELEILLKKLEMENQTWQRVARENEAMVFSLNNTMEQLREQQQQQQVGCCDDNNGVDDAESCCEVETEEKTEENRGFVGGTSTIMACKSCNSRSSCVLFLPCRHLCSCKDCAAFLDCCPVCRTPKKASIEVLIS